MQQILLTIFSDYNLFWTGYILMFVGFWAFCFASICYKKFYKNPFIYITICGAMLVFYIG